MAIRPFLINSVCVVLVSTTQSTALYASVSFYTRYDTALGQWIGPDYVNGNERSKAVAVPNAVAAQGIPVAMFCYAGTWVIYSGTNYSGSSRLFKYYPTSQKALCRLTESVSFPGMVGNVTVVSYRPIGNVTDIKADSVTFFENPDYTGKIVTSVSRNETFNGGINVGSCLITGTSEWCLGWTAAGQQPSKSTIKAYDCVEDWTGTVVLSISKNACP